MKNKNETDSAPSMNIVRNKGNEPKIKTVHIGQQVKAIRTQNKFTLEEASRRTGLAKSTLSKIENEQISPTFMVLQKLAAGLEIDLPQLFSQPSKAQASGRRDITKANTGKAHLTPTYEHELLATELSNKKMLPYKTCIRSRSFDEYDDWIRHEGEDFLFVLDGDIQLFTEFYEPAFLSKGDSAYYDATMGHAVISVSEQDAHILWVTST
ncbi:XRE family transcriptional regulator [Shewanella sp. D64]|uniref:helix-turn-helix domain-containing protein n=1 Tax=unclassified Shewanella TaxID=196818 RepID=UPI0022BA43A4|nr:MULTISPECIES: XRE family transcriptional regulator [unclassified Shewanella]MEC4724590.1 XRE family transcriptional regulator [Shewanella sp. D64]MEC4736633.1 XRE family transcriptional regulator [Shewanella sp. E94]WBJ94695.1 XRE family transcriptional regulator [Shewanella sp. MTB7]